MPSNGTNRYSIREQTPGRFTARWYNDAGQRQSQTFGSRTEAKRFLDNIKSDRNRGDYIDPKDSRRTVEDIAEMWFESKNLRPGTRRAYRTILEFRIYPTFRRTPIGAVTTMDLVSWISFLSRPRSATPGVQPATPSTPLGVQPGAGLSPGTVHNAVRVMKQILDAAVRARYLRGNPAAGLTRDDMPRPIVKEMLFLTAAQTHALAQHFDAPYDLMIVFAAQTGMRAGEIAGLRWENVDLLRGRITVAESISTLNSDEWYVVRPKNNKTRVVPIDAALTAQLREYADRHQTFRPEAYVWPGPDNPDATKPLNWSKDFYLPLWKKAVRAAGLPKGLRFHDLRHTCAALLIAANIPAKAIQEHLGHSSYQITMDRYGHLYSDASDAVTAAMSAAFASGAVPDPRSNVTPLRAPYTG